MYARGERDGRCRVGRRFFFRVHQPLAEELRGRLSTEKPSRLTRARWHIFAYCGVSMASEFVVVCSQLTVLPWSLWEDLYIFSGTFLRKVSAWA